MVMAKLNDKQIAIVAGEIAVYNFDGDTREYLSPSNEYLPIGVGIPAHSATDAPGVQRDGFAICRAHDGVGWEYIEDHRGETVYDTETRQPMVITRPGAYANNVTTIAPLTPYDKWNGERWVTDMSAQHAADVMDAEQKKKALLSEAQATISLWQTELQLGIISDGDKVKLVSWMKYIQALNIIDTSLAPDIAWPTKPE
ncbi:tail fiber assembly protein [Edwardsiella tarda]